MECKFSNDLGTITIPESVLSMVAGNAALECYGIVAMAPKRAKDGITELLGRENLSRGVRISINEDEVNVDLYIIVEYGISIAEVARTIVQTVTYKLEKETGVKVGKINISVEDIRI